MSAQLLEFYFPATGSCCGTISLPVQPELSSELSLAYTRDLEPAGVQPAALSGTLVITNKSPSTASIIDVASNTILATLPTGNGPYEVVLSGDGSTAVVRGRPSKVTPDVGTVVIPDMNSNEIRFLDRASHRELSRVALPVTGPQGVEITPDGRFPFVSPSKQARVAIVNVRTRAVVGYIASGNTPDGIAYTARVMSK